MNPELKRVKSILLAVLLIGIIPVGLAYAQIIKIPADSGNGFSWPYYLSIPDSVGTSSIILVMPNNTGTGSDDPTVHDASAYQDVTNWTDFAGELGVPLLIPTFPRPFNEWWLYTHALDRDSLLTESAGLVRVDLQLKAMIDDARNRLASKGIYAEKKVLMMGFSASAQFTSRFTVLHPDRVKAAAVGAPGYPIAPVSSWQGQSLRYPVGTFDYSTLTGKSLNTAAFKLIPLYFFVGGTDTNDPVDYEDGFDPEDKTVIDALFGDTVIGRWPNVKAVYDSIGSNSEFVIYPGVGHSFTHEMTQAVKSFFGVENRAAPDISIDPVSQNFGEVKLGGISQKAFTLTNDGSSLLQVISTSVVDGAGQFTVTSGGGGANLWMGSHREITISFQPTSPGTKSAVFRVISNDPDHPLFEVTLTGLGKSLSNSALPLLLLDDSH